MCVCERQRMCVCVCVCIRTQAAFLLVLYLGQYLFRWLFWWPYVSDPVMNLVDLMYLANVSLVLLDEPHSGFYVHGRNHSQHSDATLK